LIGSILCVLGGAKEVGEESVDIIGEFGDFLCGFFGDFGGLFIVEHLEKFSLLKYYYRH
jgi:hypothetical protein